MPLPLEEVVALACENSEVVTRPANKIALLGSILVKLGESREKYLAHAIRQIDQLLQTLLHNQRLGGRSAADGRMERMVMGVISRANFKPIMRDLRPQIYDLLLRVDSSIEHYLPNTARSLRAGTPLIDMRRTEDLRIRNAWVKGSSPFCSHFSDQRRRDRCVTAHVQ